MSETTEYPEFPSEASDDSVPEQPEVQETPEPAAPEQPETPPSEEGTETSEDDATVEAPSMDPYSVQAVGTDPTHSAQEEDEGGLSLDEVVQQVFDGKWGNGQQQRLRLAAAGYDHVEVHEAVIAKMNANRDM